jgi:hypothetical protein
MQQLEDVSELWSLNQKLSGPDNASVELPVSWIPLGYYGLGCLKMSGCVLRNFKSERVAAELFRTLDVVEKMVDERGFEPPASSLRTRKNLS